MTQDWKPTMNLKIDRGVLYQRWDRLRTHERDSERMSVQKQWRPVQGQGQQNILKDGE